VGALDYLAIFSACSAGELLLDFSPLHAAITVGSGSGGGIVVDRGNAPGHCARRMAFSRNTDRAVRLFTILEAVGFE